MVETRHDSGGGYLYIYGSLLSSFFIPASKLVRKGSGEQVKTILYSKRRVVIGGVYSIEGELHICRGPYLSLEATHNASTLLRPKEVNHSSLYLDYLFDSSGCDEWNGDVSMDDPLLTPGEESSYNNTVFTGDLSEFFNQGNTEVVSYKTDALSKVRPDKAIGVRSRGMCKGGRKWLLCPTKWRKVSRTRQ